MATTRAPWLEDHDEFEGVGAHELNLRYDHVDGGDWDEALRQLTAPTLHQTPALFRAQLFIDTVPVRFDGADISHYQDDAGPINWAALRGVSWWIAMKATQSTKGLDPTFAVHWAQAANLAFTHRLAYHWLSSTTDPALQAAWFLNVVGNLKPGDGVMIDAEEFGVSVAKVVAFAETVESYTRRPCSVYTGAYVAGGTIWQSTAVRISAYGPRPMHLAAYTTEAKALSLPGVKAYPWDAWQYSSNGPVIGVVGRCDMNRVDNVAHFDIACGNTATPTPQPEDDDMITETDIWKDSVSEGDKFVLMREGRFRPISETELTLLGIKLTVALGKPVSKADRDTLDAVAGPGTPGDIKGPIKLSLSLSGGASGTLG